MCGIAGLVLPPGSLADPATAGRMIAALLHRGPDDHGWLSAAGDALTTGRDPKSAPPGDVTLVNCRLAIIDLTEDGWQPMSTPDGRYQIVYNGELYNYIELRTKLEAAGHTFRSRSDTEVLLHALAEWGTGALTELVGMFTFALLDTRERKLLLARDFFGIKPLYYARSGGGIAFASETKVLLGLPGLDRTLNAQRTYDYLRFGLTDHGGQTMLGAIRQLPSAHYLEVDLDRPGLLPAPVRYWSPRPSPEAAGLSFDDAAHRLRDLFLESVSLHLRSDVPVGVALSGGIDSSAVLSAMRHLAGPGLDLHAFSFIGDGAAISEERWIDIVGDASGATVHKVKPEPTDLARDIGALVAAQDEPFRSTSMYAQYRVFRLAQEAGIRVTLDGQGADEILGGYRHYLAARVASSVRRGRLREAAQLTSAMRTLPGTNPARLLAQAGGYFLPSAMHAGARRVARAGLAPDWLSTDWVERQDVRLAAVQPTPRSGILTATLTDAVTRTGLPALLRYEDRNSMAHSVESRVPFLTPQLVNFCLGLPEEHIIAADGTTKAVFRKAMRGLVPDAILDRRDKIGFETPELTWMRALEGWVTDAILSPVAARIGPLNQPVMRREWDDVLAGRKPFGSHIWRWVNLIRWAELNEVTLDG